MSARDTDRDEIVAQRLRAIHHRRMTARMRTNEGAQDVYRALSAADGELTSRGVKFEAHVSECSAEHWLRRFIDLGIVEARASDEDGRVPVYSLRDPRTARIEEVGWR